MLYRKLMWALAAHAPPGPASHARPGAGPHAALQGSHMCDPKTCRMRHVYGRRMRLPRPA
jgi:hypothetical protein